MKCGHCNWLPILENLDNKEAGGFLPVNEGVNAGVFLLVNAKCAKKTIKVNNFFCKKFVILSLYNIVSTWFSRKKPKVFYI